MLVTGAVYTLIGIRNRYVHTFFSTAYLAALGIAVLIVYVMSVPVSTALQGGYVAAIILSSSAIGVGSIFFKELTEGLGCALGGFCVSMWLLTLIPGGLLKPIPSKAIFMSAFTLVAFAFYFSRYTRDWALISMISFSGATVVVLGIDCFSRAGLKEFWAYVWQLNKNLFPLGADTYPVTKGIRVETAAIFIIFMVGIISQIKLWRIVREKREQRAAERAEGQRNLEQEEEDVGREVEERNRRERREWERVHGNGDFGSSSVSRASGDGNSEKKLKGSCGRNSEVEVIEMADMSDSDRGQKAPEPLTETDENGKLTVRVVEDDVPEGVEESEDEMPARGSGAKKRAASSETKRQSQTVVTEPPAVVPLPFSVPKDEDTKSRNSRSSIATFADEEEEPAEVPTRQDSFAKRLSHGSSKLLRNLSPRSSRLVTSPEIGGESSEELVVPKAHREDDESSLAATLDNQSVDDGSRRASLLAAEQGQDIEIAARLSTSDVRPEQDKSARSSLAQDDKPQTKSLRPNSIDTVPTRMSAELSNKKSEAEVGGTPTTHSRMDEVEDAGPTPSEKPKSTTSGVSSRASLTKERLPRSLSRVAMSYRTNEWAKHLSYADAPEPDELQIAEAPKPTTTKSKSKKEREQPVPVNVDELQQRNEDGVQAPALNRSESRNSMASVTRNTSKKESKQSIPPSASAPVLSPVEREQTFSPPPPPANPPMARSASAMALRRGSTTFEPIAEEHDNQPAPAPIPEEQEQAMSTSPSLAGDNSNRASIPGVVSYASPQTLLGQREMFLRSKSQGNLLSQSPDPYAMNRPPSETGSISNYPMYAAALAADPDDIPLSQRKQMMHRHSSMMSLAGIHPNQQPQPLQRSSSGFELNNHTPFDSHQPNRSSTLPTPAAREAALANFRASVNSDLNRGSAMITPSGRETPFASTNNLLSTGREAEVQRNIQMQRNMLLGQKEAEAQRKEMTRQQKEWADRAFDEKMRSGELMDAHREAMRKMQQSGGGSKKK